MSARAIKPGFKQTEVGVIPQDWEVHCIGDYNPFITSGSRGWATYYSEIGSVFIRITNLSRNSIYLDLDDIRYVRLPEHNGEAQRTQLRDGDLLISITADIGIIGYVTDAVEKPAFINQHIAMVRFAADILSSRFLSYFLAAAPQQRRFHALTDSGAKAGMNLTTIRQLQFGCPSTKAEQDAIAEALSDADALIEALEQILAKKRDLKQGAMQELLSGKRRLPGFDVQRGFKPSDIGLLPLDWDVTTVGREFSIQLGKMLDADKNIGEPKPYIGNRAVQWGKIDLEQVGLIKLAPHEIQKFQLRKGDLLVCEGGEFGRSAIWNAEIDECYYQKAIHRLRARRGYNSTFLLNLLKLMSGNGGLQNFVTQTSIAHLPKDKFELVPIPLPSSSKEQSAIAAILSDMDAEIDALEQKLAKARAVKQGMMQQLLTGQVRLI